MTVFVSMFCSLAVVLFWGNITAIYPVVDVIMVGKSVPGWLDELAEQKRREIADLEAAIAPAEKNAAGDSNEANDKGKTPRHLVDA